MSESGFSGLKDFQDKKCQRIEVFRMIDDKLTYQIIGCALDVHKTLGNGFQEVIYQRCLAIEMESAGLSFGREVEQPIFYRGVKWERDAQILLSPIKSSLN